VGRGVVPPFVLVKKAGGRNEGRKRTPAASISEKKGERYLGDIKTSTT